MTTAVIYSRVSTKQQAADDRTSLALQERESRDYAAREGWPVAGAFSDTITGYETLDDRPGLQRVRALIQSGEADAVLIWKYDRGARDQLDLLLLHREVSQAGGRFISVTQGEVENTAQGRMMLGLQGSFAEIEREAIRDRLQGNMRAKVVEGRIKVGPVPKYGYSWAGDKKNTYVINPETTPTVQRLYQMADDGKSLQEMARVLNNEGIPTPSQYLASKGKLPGTRKVATSWARQSIFQLLTDPTYAGRHVAYRRQAIKRGKRKIMKLRDASDETRIEQTIPAIVTQEQWDRVRAAVSSKTLARSNVVNQEEMPLLSRGIAYCGHCGARAIVMKHHTGYRGYACPNRANRVDGDRPTCPGGFWFVRASEVDSDTWAKVEEMAKNTERFQEMILAPIHAAQARLEQVTKQDAAIAAELEQARKDRDTISRRMATEEDDAIAAIYRSQLKDTLNLIAGLESRQVSSDRRLEQVRAYLDVLIATVGAQKAGGKVKLVPPPGTPPTQAEMFELEWREHPNTPLPAGWTTVRELTREQKRSLLRAIGARVLMYAGKSDWARENGKRWDLQIIPSVYAQESIS